MPRAPGWWPAANTSVGRTSSTIASSGAARTRSSGGCASTGSPRLSSTIRSLFGGRAGGGPPPCAGVDPADPPLVRRPRRLRPQPCVHEVREPALQRRVEAALEADRGRRLRAHRRTAQRAGHVTGEDLDAVAELDEPAQAVEQALGSFPRLDREVGTPRVADEERVTGEDEPRFVAPRAVDHREAAVLGAVPRRVDRAEHDVADLDLAPVLERLVRERRLGFPVDADRDPELEREASVTRDVVCVRVSLERTDEHDVVALRLGEHRLDVVRRIDDYPNAGTLVANQVRGAAQVVVQELLEEHGCDASTGCGYESESGARPAAGTSSRACSSSSRRMTNQPIASRKTSVCSPFIRIPPRFWSRMGDSPHRRGACS